MTYNPNEYIGVPKIGMLKIGVPKISMPNVFGNTAFVCGGDDIVNGNTIIVTATTDSVDLRINNIVKTYTTTPNQPTRIVIERDINSIYNLCLNQKNIISIDLSALDVSDIELIAGLFNGCENLESFDISTFNTSNATRIGGMFAYCKKLTTINLSNFDTSNATAFSDMFYHCDSLVILDISSFDFSKAVVGNFFAYCSSLQNLNFGRNLKVSIDLHWSPLTHESALSVINGLAEVATPQTVTFKTTTYNTLAEEEIALATSKGWNVVSA